MQYHRANVADATDTDGQHHIDGIVGPRVFPVGDSHVCVLGVGRAHQPIVGIIADEASQQLGRGESFGCDDDCVTFVRLAARKDDPVVAAAFQAFDGAGKMNSILS